MFSWSYLFSDNALNRGKAYYDRVHDVKRVGNKIFAFVEGSSSYSVCITLKNDSVKSVECNCFNDSKCKHEVALLHYIEEHEYLLSDNRDDKIVNDIYSMDKDCLQRVLIRLLEDNEYNDRITDIINEEKSDKEKIFNKLKSIMANMDYDDYMIISPIMEFIDYDINILIENGDYDCATSLLNIIVEEYLFGHIRINYNSEDMLTDKYLHYSEILLDNDEVSGENKDKMAEYVDRIYYP
ncbi:MAG: hypothetical protein BZ137_00295 [Methanosphaera sp. rholeuAM130]|nr:hypothetical protein [Methanosphaera sp.]RAP54801.1 MAG: hypothetical protein BZ137_00295 [Methanosphaera sp. rholeuAM130]